MKMNSIVKRTCVLLICIMSYACISTRISIAALSASDPVPVDVLQYKGPGLHEWVKVKIGSYNNITVNAGFYDIQLTAGLDSDWSMDYNGLAFCGESRPISPGIYDEYVLYEIDAGSPIMGAVYLMEQHLGEAITPHLAASLQIAIWEAILDPGQFNLNKGNFRVRSTNRKWDRNQSLLWLAELASADLNSVNTDAYRFVSDDGILSSAGTRDFIVKNCALDNTAPIVPVPAAVWLLGSGLLGVFLLRKKWFKKSLRCTEDARDLY